MTAWLARLDGSGRVMRCGDCGAELGRIWDDGTGQRHFVFPSAMACVAGIWAKTRRARRAEHFGHAPYRRQLPVARSLDPTGKPFQSVGLEPKAYPATVRCARCRRVQLLDAAVAGVVVPVDDGRPEPYLTWPFAEPFATIGVPSEDED